jgi:hypothetical protein
MSVATAEGATIMSRLNRLAAGLPKVLRVESQRVATQSRRGARSLNHRSAAIGMEAPEGRALLASLLATNQAGGATYLLVGPSSPYPKLRTVKIHGYQYQVRASDTNLNWMLIRITTNTVIDAPDSQSIPSVYGNVVQRFALTTLGQAERNGHNPVYPTDFESDTPPTGAEVLKLMPYPNTPT